VLAQQEGEAVVMEAAVDGAMQAVRVGGVHRGRGQSSGEWVGGAAVR
jgi:hypothetical protein